MVSLSFSGSHLSFKTVCHLEDWVVSLANVPSWILAQVKGGVLSPLSQSPIDTRITHATIIFSTPFLVLYGITVTDFGAIWLGAIVYG